MRLNKFLARAGMASRRKCDQLIASGRVIINGRIMKNYAYNVDQEDVVVCGTISTRFRQTRNPVTGRVNEPTMLN